MSLSESDLAVSYKDILINQIGNVLPLQVQGENLKYLTQLCFKFLSPHKLERTHFAAVKQIAVEVGCHALQVSMNSRPAICIVKGLNKALDVTEYILDRLDPLDPPEGTAEPENVPFQDYLALGSHDFTSTPKTSLQLSSSPSCRFLLWKFLISEEESRVRRVVIRCIALPFRLLLQCLGWLELKFTHTASPHAKLQRPKVAAKRRIVWMSWMVLHLMEWIGLLRKQRILHRNFEISDQVSPVSCSTKRKLLGPVVDIMHSSEETDRSDSGADLLGGMSEGDTNSSGGSHKQTSRDKNFKMTVAGDTADTRDKGYDSNSSKESENSTKAQSNKDDDKVEFLVASTGLCEDQGPDGKCNISESYSATLNSSLETQDHECPCTATKVVNSDQADKRYKTSENSAALKMSLTPLPPQSQNTPSRASEMTWLQDSPATGPFVPASSSSPNSSTQSAVSTPQAAWNTDKMEQELKISNSPEKLQQQC